MSSSQAVAAPGSDVLSAGVPDTPSEMLAAAKTARRDADAAEARLFGLAAGWADLHSVDAVAGTPAAYFYGSEEISPVAGGVPGFAAWAAADFATNVGLSTEAGVGLIAEALETRHRLPKIWGRMMAGEVPVWRARRIAAQTTSLPADGADFVDRHIAYVAHSVGVAQLDRLVAEARMRFDPETAEVQRKQAAEDRYFTIEHDRVTYTGSSHVHGTLDLADAIELERAVATGAHELATLGSDDTLDVRRSQAIGILARGQLALKFGQGPALAEVSTGSDRATSNPPRGWTSHRHVELVIHTTAEAVVGDLSSGVVGRCSTTGTPILINQVRDWLDAPDVKLAIRPVIDTTNTAHVDRYEIPDRMSHAVEERDVTCVFPYCHRQATSCDKDHVIPWPHGQTSLINLAALCRRHHRLKTAGLWTYQITSPGHYRWTNRFGQQYLRDPLGTTEMGPDVDAGQDDTG